jgi:GNAT superfamily N-acetyltransferase
MPVRPNPAALFRGGLGPFLGRVLRRACAPFAAWEALLFYERDLTQTRVPETLRAKVPVDVRLATAEEMRPLLPEGPAETDRRFAAGDLCFIAVSDGRIVHYTWLATRPTYIPEIGARILLRPGQTYLYHSFTEESARGLGVQSALGPFVIRYQKEHGIEQHFLYVKSHNYSGRQVLSRLQPPPRRIRVVRRFRIGRRGFLVRGLSTPDPLFEVEPKAVRDWRPLGFWLPGAAE